MFLPNTELTISWKYHSRVCRMYAFSASCPIFYTVNTQARAKIYSTQTDDLLNSYVGFYALKKYLSLFKLKPNQDICVLLIMVLYVRGIIAIKKHSPQQGRVTST